MTKHSDIRWKWLEERGFNVLSDRHQYAYIQALWSPTDVVQACFCDSPAGTGKTTLAVLAGAYEVERGNYDKIIYLRNAVPLREIGYLPGEQADKEAPYMAPFIEALDRVQPGLYEKWSKPDTLKKESPKVFTMTSTFTRGITWDRAFIIVDESQSYDLEELQAIFTRPTDSCKIVSIGSIRQNDNRRQRKYNGLTPWEVYMSHFEGQRVTYHKLERNYRGWFSNHSDNIDETVANLI